MKKLNCLLRAAVPLTMLGVLAGPMLAQFQGITGVSVSLDVVNNINGKSLHDQRGIGFTVYSAKFLCGTIQPTIVPPIPTLPELGADLLAPGTYFTVINILNPNPLAHAKFTPAAVQTKPLGQVQDKSSFGFPVDLPEQQGFDLDCASILKFFHPDITPATARNMLFHTFIKGYVMLQQSGGQTGELEVTAVYTLKDVQDGKAPGPPIELF